MLVNTNATIISDLKYGEVDLFVKCFVQKNRLKSYLPHGILKSKKRKSKTSMSQLSSQLVLVAKHKDIGTLEYSQETRMLSTYRTMHTDVVKSKMVVVISKILLNSIQKEEENGSLYHYLETTLNWLAHHEKFANFHLLFMLKLSRHLCFYSYDSNTNPDYFNMLDRVLQDMETNNYCIECQNYLVLKQLLCINFDELELLKLTKTNRTHFLEMLLLYYQFHIDAFKKPKSLAVLHEIFN